MALLTTHAAVDCIAASGPLPGRAITLRAQEKLSVVSSLYLMSLPKTLETSLWIAGTLWQVSRLPVISRIPSRKFIPAENHWFGGYTAWALGRIGGSKAKAVLESRSKREDSNFVVTELEAALPASKRLHHAPSLTTGPGSTTARRHLSRQARYL